MKIKLILLYLFCFNIYSTNIEIIVAVDQWPPFRILEENNNHTGIDFDLWKIIQEELGINIKFERYPWGRALHKLEKGEVDAMSGLAYTEERARVFFYSELPYYTCNPIFYLPRGKGKQIKNYWDLYSLNRIGFVIGSAYFEKFDRDIHLKKIAVPTEIQLIKMLEANRLDAIIGTECQVDYELKKLGLSNLFDKSLYKPDKEIDLYIVFSKHSDKSFLLDRINKILERLHREKMIKVESQKYF